MDQVKHIGSSFDATLYGLRNDVLMMSSLTDRLFHSAFEALWNRASELCAQVVTDDHEIDILEKTGCSSRLGDVGLEELR